MSAQPTTSRKVYSPEERAGFLSWRFGSTLDWSTTILVEIGYPVAELRWFIDAVQGICKGKERRIAHTTLAKRAQRFHNKSQAQALALRAIKANRAWALEHRCMVFEVERPKPREREGKDKRARTKYTDWLTPAAVWAQDTEHKVKKSDEIRWKADREYRLEKRREILSEALKMLPMFEKAEDMPPSAQPKEESVFDLSAYIKQREDILLAENKRILGKLLEGDLIDEDELDDRLIKLEVYNQRATAALNQSYISARKVLEGMKKDRLLRAANLSDPAEIVAPIDALFEQKKSDTPQTTPPTGNNIYKGNAGVTLSVPAGWVDDAVAESAARSLAPTESRLPEQGQKKGNAGVTPTCAPQTKLEWALSHAKEGFRVIPNHWITEAGGCSCEKGLTCSTPGKHPLIGGWQSKGTSDESQVRQWWLRWPEANPGIVTGPESNVVVLDVDVDKGGAESFCALFEEVGGPPETRVSRTGSGGFHLFFTYPQGVDIHNLQASKKLGAGLDIRGWNGQAVAPGSVHKSGRVYEWLNDYPLLPMPQFIVDRLIAPQPVEIKETVIKAGVYQSVGSSPIQKGERDDRLYGICSAIWNEDYSPDEAFAYLLDVRNKRVVDIPGDPITDADLRRIVKSVYERAIRESWVKPAKNSEPVLLEGVL